MTFDLGAFRRSITNDFYTFDDFIYWPQINDRLHGLHKPAMCLQSWHAAGADALALGRLVLAEPLVLEILRTLLALPSESISFADGRELPARQPKNIDEANSVSQLLLDMGVAQALDQGASVIALLMVAEIAQDSKSRRTRLGKKLEQRIASTLADVAVAASIRVSRPVQIAKSIRADYIAAARQLDYFVLVDSKPILGILISFQTAQGGRQTRDLSIIYPQLQDALSSIPLDLVVIADGHGIQAASDKVLTSLANAVGALITIKQAADGVLLEKIVEAAEFGAKKAKTSDAVREMIGAGLGSGNAVQANQLPVSEEEARLAIARYAAQNTELSLNLSSDSKKISWQREAEVKAASAIVKQYDAGSALNLLADLLGTHISISLLEDKSEISFGVVSLKEDAIIPGQLVVAATQHAADKTSLRQVSRIALENTQSSRVAVLVVPSVPSSTDFEDFRRAQKELSISVVVLDPNSILKLAKTSIKVRDALVGQILAQSDLSKVSPFVLNSAVPQRMFYGREIEEATLLSTLSTNSVALLGGRRIGKTSLMHSVRIALSDAGFVPVFADCQSVRNWDEFGAVIERTWEVPAQRPFKPEYLLKSIDALAKKADGKLVVLLDEIDQLLDWDQHHSGSEVPEALFRTFRTLSQEGVAQFLFSGERTIARKIWDPQSPHWNFCRPLMLRQLTKESAQRLLLNPLLSMQIKISDEKGLSDLAWAYTSGHPQILQFLGDRVVAKLNERHASDRLDMGPEVLVSVVTSFEYAEHYLSTYWGQSTNVERIVSLLIALGDVDAAAISQKLEQLGVTINPTGLQQGLRMLELYGLIDKTEVGYCLRATYFVDALTHYGGPSAVLKSLVQKEEM